MTELHGGGRIMSRADRVKAVRTGLVKRRLRLERSIAHVRDAGREPRRSDLERWANLSAEVGEFERVLAKLMAGEDVAPSPLTGGRMVELPDGPLVELPGEADDAER